MLHRARSCWNDPHRDIARKLSEQPELFLVATAGGSIVATAMAGFDGHRGWMYYLAVLMIRSTNHEVIAFYRKLGYAQDDVLILGRRLIDDTGA